MDNCCCFHPGVAVFHEGLKGWSCCSKKVINFDDFMQIPGCAVGKHTDVDTRPKDTPRPSPAMDVKLVGSDQTGEKYKTAEQPLTKGYTHQPIDKKTITPEKKGQDPLVQQQPHNLPSVSSHCTRKRTILWACQLTVGHRVCTEDAIIR